MALWRKWQHALDKILVYTSSVRYSKKLLEDAVIGCVCVADVCRKLGLRPDGNSSAYLKKCINKFGIDISMFVGNRKTNLGIYGGQNKKRAEEVLILTDKYAVHPGAYRLRRAMKEVGIEYICSLCGIGPEWNGQLLVLQVDHKNGINWDHRPHNVRFLCPNCHSQTENFCVKNKKRADMEKMEASLDSNSSALE